MFGWYYWEDCSLLKENGRVLDLGERGCRERFVRVGGEERLWGEGVRSRCKVNK